MVAVGLSFVTAGATLGALGIGFANFCRGNHRATCCRWCCWRFRWRIGFYRDDKSVKGAVIGAISAEWRKGHSGNKSGESFGALGEVGRDIAHGVAQGLVSEVSGGDFKSGFLGASLAILQEGKLSFALETMETVSWGNLVGRTSVAAVAGGTASSLGGGKFANGAVSAAFFSPI